ncbi:MAG: HK97 family phage prohead protease [Rhodobacter sp.]|nr:HK97 family phage prohead protease [Rhodobacter sp.]MCA3492818.1 HK97 family phage prohead protease [Rhodobacter sp.]MCA3500474.1 HK97 family phage prohead protease [Rhodobacter sp.]MCA3502034.1 HK97 family phage prohead protease [Rhodobacter sp.]MCA3518146.1 HK97 family phage prohead protease [Rhodobacter sp.]
MTPEIKLTDTTRLSPAFEARFASPDDAGMITGLAAGFGDALVDAFGDTIAKGAFAASIKSHKAAGTMPAMLWQHDPAEPIGVWTDAAEIDTGLSVTGQINLDTQRGREALSLLRQGAFRGLSIGFRAKGAEMLKGGVRRLTAIDLLEVSLVTFPARREGAITEVRDLRDLEQRLRSAGVARAAAQKVAAAGWAALNRKETDNLAEIARRLAATAAKL